MANRNLDFIPTVTRVVPDNPDTSTLTNTILALGDQVAQASAQTKALQAVADTQVGFKKLDAEFRAQYADDPTNADGRKKLAEARKSLVTQVGKTVPTVVMRDFTNKTIELGEQSDASNEVWATKQQVRNSVSNMQTARTTYLRDANQAGRDFGNTPDGDLADAMNFMQANQSIRDFAAPVIGRPRTDAYLKTFNADYVKSFVSGVAENNPKMAAELLDNPIIKDQFSTADRGDMIDLIKKTKRQQELGQQLKTVADTSTVPDIVNDPQMTYMEKRSKIDILDMQGSISPQAAADARRVLKSSEDLDSQTDTPVMAEIIRRVYDLNSNTSLKQSEYLNGVKGVQEDVLAQQAAGMLTGQDAVKLNNEIKTLTQKRVAEATKSVGYQFSAANRKFDALPPEYRGQATRELFYASQGQNFSQQQYANKADEIVQQINQERRQHALSIVSRTTNDDVFLQATGYSRQDVADTAAKRGLTQEQVIQALRDKYAKKQKRPGRVSAVRPDAEAPVQDEGGIRLDAPPPDEEFIEDGEE